MNLEQRFSVASPLPVVWAAFHQPQLLVDCLPGASLTGPQQDGVLPLLFKIKLGPIAAAFAGSGQLALDEAAHSGAFAGQATDGRNNSRVKGEARFQLAEDGAGTQVGVAIEFAITGSLAQFSREGIVRALADQLTRQFAENLQRQLTDAQQGAPASPTATPQPSSADTAGPAAARDPTDDATVLIDGPSAFPPLPRQRDDAAPALDLLTLAGAMLRRAWHRLLGRKEA